MPMVHPFRAGGSTDGRSHALAPGFLAYAASFSLAAATGSTLRAETAADVIFRNGPIYPMARAGDAKVEAAHGAHSSPGSNRIAHAIMARPDQIARMKAQGCEANFMTDFVYFYRADDRDKLFGPERAAFMVPLGAAAKAAAGYSLHSDNPAAGPPRPRDGTAWWLPRMEALCNPDYIPQGCGSWTACSRFTRNLQSAFDLKR